MLFMLLRKHNFFGLVVSESLTTNDELQEEVRERRFLSFCCKYFIYNVVSRKDNAVWRLHSLFRFWKGGEENEVNQRKTIVS